MNDKLVGKLLVRPVATTNGEKALLVFGVLKCDNIEEVANNDELWVVKMTVNESLKWKSDNSPTWKLSPEDILDNWAELASKKAWEND